jgi:hypothetical protein
MFAHAFFPPIPPRLLPVSVQALGERMPLMVGPRWAILPQLGQSELRCAVRMVKDRHQVPDHRAKAVPKARLLAFPGCTSWLLLGRSLAGLLQEAPTQGPELRGPCYACLILLGCTPCLALSAGREARVLEGAPAMLDRMALVCLPSGSRLHGFDGCGETWRVLRDGRGHLEAAVCASLQTWLRLLPLLRRRFMGEQAAVLLLLDHHPTVVWAQRVIAVTRTRRPRQAAQPVLQPRLWSRAVRAHGIHPACDR